MTQATAPEPHSHNYTALAHAILQKADADPEGVAELAAMALRFVKEVCDEHA